VTLASSDTIHSKQLFESTLLEHGINTTSYHCDNGVFTSAEFERHLLDQGQGYRISGVGAHHQNGVAERAIQTVVWNARTMLTHAQIHWPDSFDANLWPFAMDYATWIYNRTPGDSGFAPIELVSGILLDCHQLRRCRVWGCPSYVLDPRLQDGRKIPKWEPRARQGQFLGFSKTHSTTVGLIRNLRTGFISPQYHVVHDERFTTVTTSDSIIDTIEATWQDLFTTSRDNYLDGLDVDPASIPDLHDSWKPIQPSVSPSSPIHPEIDPVFHDDPAVPDLVRDHSPTDLPTPIALDFGDASFPTSEGSSIAPSPSIDSPPVPSPTSPTRRDQSPQAPTGRGLRDRRPNRRFIGEEWINVHRGDSNTFQAYLRTLTTEGVFLSNIDWSGPVASNYLSLMQPCNELFTNDVIEHPMAFQLSPQLSDSPTLRDILRSTNEGERSDWFDAMNDEIEALLLKNTFRKVPRDLPVSLGKEIVGTTWVLKRKRRPDGSIIKLKARLVVRGDQQRQIGTHTDVTYSPVVAWSTVRLLFTLATALNLPTKQIDFRNAFVQSDLPEPIYVELPPGGYRNHPENAGMVLEVTKSLYGDRRAPKLWYKYLRSTLESIGFAMDDQDTCLFTMPGCIFVVYVDDAILVANKQETIDNVLQQLEDHGMDLERMGSLSDFLGVKVHHNEDGTLELVQPSLTKRFIELLGLQQSRPVSTPAEGPLGKCITDPPASGDFNYQSAVGIAMFLTNNTRLDCAMAVHQCARYSADPRQRHEVAMKRIGRYLLGTVDNGLIIKPTTDLKLNCYADADYCGLFNLEDAEDPDAVRSRTGYLLTLGDVPVCWSSKLQTSIALSTMEAEYIALATAMRTLLPLKSILKTMAHSLGLENLLGDQLSIVYEDNEAALTLATTDPPRMTPRSKHIAVKYHWFRRHLKKGYIEVHHIGSNDQKADILTKALARIKHERARLLTMGW
jgi:hypothetical protein